MMYMSNNLKKEKLVYMMFYFNILNKNTWNKKILKLNFKFLTF